MQKRRKGTINQIFYRPKNKLRFTDECKAGIKIVIFFSQKISNFSESAYFRNSVILYFRKCFWFSRSTLIRSYGFRPSTNLTRFVNAAAFGV